MFIHASLIVFGAMAAARLVLLDIRNVVRWWFLSVLVWGSVFRVFFLDVLGLGLKVDSLSWLFGKRR